MSSVIHRYAPHERQLLASQRLQQRRMDRCAVQQSARGTAGRTSLSQSQHRASSAASNGHSQRRRHDNNTDYSRMNCDLLREVEERNKTDREAKKLASMTTQLADDALRAQWAHPRGSSAATMEALTNQSPRRAQLVRDMSADAAAQEDQEQREHEHRSNLPDYLIRRRAEQERERRAASQAQAVAESERNFPKGQEPLNPDVAERTREFLELRVSELETALRQLPFRAECSQLGRRRKADLETQLRDTESALAKFNFPVVFVKASHPQPVLVARPTAPATAKGSAPPGAVPASHAKRHY